MPYRYAVGDEAGQPGFGRQPGSTRFFVVVLLLLNEPQRLRDQVSWLHHQMGIPERVEFKFHKTSDMLCSWTRCVAFWLPANENGRVLRILLPGSG